MIDHVLPVSTSSSQRIRLKSCVNPSQTSIEDIRKELNQLIAFAFKVEKNVLHIREFASSVSSMLSTKCLGAPSGLLSLGMSLRPTTQAVHMVAPSTEFF